jgi:hypothetical protein
VALNLVLEIEEPVICVFHDDERTGRMAYENGLVIGVMDFGRRGLGDIRRDLNQRTQCSPNQVVFPCPNDLDRGNRMPGNVCRHCNDPPLFVAEVHYPDHSPW